MNYVLKQKDLRWQWKIFQTNRRVIGIESLPFPIIDVLGEIQGFKNQMNRARNEVKLDTNTRAAWLANSLIKISLTVFSKLNFNLMAFNQCECKSTLEFFGMSDASTQPNLHLHTFEIELNSEYFNLTKLPLSKDLLNRVHWEISNHVLTWNKKIINKLNKVVILWREPENRHNLSNWNISAFRNQTYTHTCRSRKVRIYETFVKVDILYKILLLKTFYKWNTYWRPYWCLWRCSKFWMTNDAFLETV